MGIINFYAASLYKTSWDICKLAKSKIYSCLFKINVKNLS